MEISEVSELHDANEVIQIAAGNDVHVIWAPGDATRYQVWVTRTVAYGPYAALDPANDRTFLMVMVVSDPRALVFNQPFDVGDAWSPERFLRQFGHQFAGWWAGVRPLLAALCWTTTECSSRDYDPNDAAVIGQLLAVGRDR